MGMGGDCYKICVGRCNFCPVQVSNVFRGGATVLKVGGQILQAKRAENFLTHFLASGRTKYCLDS